MDRVLRAPPEKSSPDTLWHVSPGTPDTSPGWENYQETIADAVKQLEEFDKDCHCHVFNNQAVIALPRYGGVKVVIEAPLDSILIEGYKSEDKKGKKSAQLKEFGSINLPNKIGGGWIDETQLVNSNGQPNSPSYPFVNQVEETHGDMNRAQTVVSELHSILVVIKRAENTHDVQMTFRLHVLADFGAKNLVETKSSDISATHGPTKILLRSLLYRKLELEQIEATD
ncbi:hypothetical protein CTI12_AA338110 [Artemisia annua]|uniref:Uncharacterized protein n=1 Tax=Artemisia annua TaxID=35608 RepID=A0A2U1MV44_ARTAN|nr:hypothetical protein CTI12_AA338110 [Artemisia annua]